MGESSISDLRAQISYLESHKFSVRINTASDLVTVADLIALDPIYTDLVLRCIDNLEHQSTILNRLKTISALPIDPRYESPWDIAITSLLLLIAQTTPQDLCIAIPLAQSAPNIWWGRALSDILLPLYQSLTSPINTLTVASEGADDQRITRAVYGEFDAISGVVGKVQYSFDQFTVVDVGRLGAELEIHKAYVLTTDYAGSIFEPGSMSPRVPIDYGRTGQWMTDTSTPGSSIGVA